MTHSDATVARLTADGSRRFLKEFYSFGDYPTYAVLNGDGEQVGTEWYAYEYDPETDTRAEIIFTTEAALIAHVLDIWRPHDRAGQNEYCRLDAEFKAGRFAA